MTGMVSIFQEWQGFPVNRVVFMPNDTRKQFSNSAGGKTFKKNVFKNLRKKQKNNNKFYRHTNTRAQLLYCWADVICICIYNGQ